MFLKFLIDSRIQIFKKTNVVGYEPRSAHIRVSQVANRGQRTRREESRGGSRRAESRVSLLQTERSKLGISENFEVHDVILGDHHFSSLRLIASKGDKGTVYAGTYANNAQSLRSGPTRPVDAIVKCGNQVVQESRINLKLD